MLLRDIVEVKSGPFNKTCTMRMAVIFVILGLLCFTILEAGGAKKSAAFAICACFIWAATGFAYSILVDHFTEGVNIEIHTFRCAGVFSTSPTNCVEDWRVQHQTLAHSCPCCLVSILS